MYLPPLLLCLAAATSAAKPPNFVVIMADDLDLLLNGTQLMTSLSKHMVEGGASLAGYVDVPVCCPSRTSTLSGRYSHNLNNTNLGWCGDFGATQENHTWVSTLRTAGYSTGLFGKYYNGYGDFCRAKVHVPSDWSYFYAMCDDNFFYGNSFSVNGTMHTVSADTYLTNVIGNSSLAWLAQQSPSGPPFFAYIAPHAPHVPATPAHEYENAPLPFPTAPRTPSFDYATQHHHWLVSEKAPLTPELVDYADSLHARRLRATMSIDDIVEGVFALLSQRGLLDSTYVLFTSDHGYNLGQFRLPSGKFHVYEHDIRVPFHVAGPGVPPGAALSSTLVSNVDIGATLLDWAGLGASGYATDGRSFAAQLGPAPPPWPRDRLLNEYWGLGYTERGPCHNGTTPCPGGVQALEDAPSNSWSALRILNATHNLAYIEYRGGSGPAWPLAPASTNFTALFDMQADPWQLVNLARNGSRAEQLAALHRELWQVATCKGSECP
jgi:N-acetylglucosamine-6-sulfatase